MQDDLQRERPVAVITHGEALIGAAVPEEHRARDMHDVLLQYDLRAGAIVVVGIGEIDGEQRVVVARVRAEQQRLRPIQAQFEMGEKARIGVIEPIRSTRGRADIAEIVGDDECITVLERAARTRSRRGSENGKFRFHRSVRFMGFDLQQQAGRACRTLDFGHGGRETPSTDGESEQCATTRNEFARPSTTFGDYVSRRNGCLRKAARLTSLCCKSSVVARRQKAPGSLPARSEAAAFASGDRMGQVPARCPSTGSPTRSPSCRGPHAPGCDSGARSSPDSRRSGCAS